MTPQDEIEWLKKDIQETSHKVNFLTKSNRTQWASIIRKQSEISSRKQRIAELKMRAKRKKSRMNSIKEEKRECNAIIDQYKSQLKSIKRKTERKLNRLDRIYQTMEGFGQISLKPLQYQIKKRRKNVNRIKQDLTSLNDQIQLLNRQKHTYQEELSEQKMKLTDLERRKALSQVTLDLPIDDLFLEAEAVKRAESFSIPDIYRNADEINFEKDINHLTALEETINQKKNTIKFRRKQIEELKQQSQSAQGSFCRIFNSKTYKFAKTEVPIDSDHINELNKHFDSFKQRHSSIEETENITLLMESGWLEEQKQIEDSWEDKIEIIQAYQQQASEIENLTFRIDEISECVKELKLDLEDYSHHKQTLQMNEIKMHKKLDIMFADAEQFQEKANILEKKNKDIIYREKLISEKRDSVNSFRENVEELELQYQNLKLNVENLETELESLKQPNMPRNTQIMTPGHVRFVDQKIPQTQKVIKRKPPPSPYISNATPKKSIIRKTNMISPTPKKVSTIHQKMMNSGFPTPDDFSIDDPKTEIVCSPLSTMKITKKTQPFETPNIIRKKNSSNLSETEEEVFIDSDASFDSNQYDNSLEESYYDDDELIQNAMDAINMSLYQPAIEV